MGLFSRSTDSASFPWIALTSVQQLEEILATPSDNARLFFKHSTRCNISAMVLRNFQQEWDPGTESVELYFLDLIAHRDVSDALAEKTAVVHQSPQVIVLKNAEVIYDASHNSIDAARIQQLV